RRDPARRPDLLGCRPAQGPRHPGGGTRRSNRLIPFEDQRARRRHRWRCRRRVHPVLARAPGLDRLRPGRASPRHQRLDLSLRWAGRQLRGSLSLTQMMMNSVDLYRNLKAEVGLETGWHEVGSLRLASSQERMEELTRQAAWAKTFGLPLELISPDEAQRMFPPMTTEGVA